MDAFIGFVSWLNWMPRLMPWGPWIILSFMSALLVVGFLTIGHRRIYTNSVRASVDFWWILGSVLTLLTVSVLFVTSKTAAVADADARDAAMLRSQIHYQSVQLYMRSGR